jgi:CBS domain-containing protein
MRLQEIMTAPVVSIGADKPATLAWSRMQDQDIRHLVVTENGRLAGVVSDRDLGGRNGGALRKNHAVRDLMTPQAASAAPRTTLREAANLMRGRLIGCLPVVDKGRVVGIVTASDVLDELGRGFIRSPRKADRQMGSGGPGIEAAPGAQRRRQPESATRAPMPARIPRGAKRASGRTASAQTPAHIRAIGVPLDRSDRDYLRRKLGAKLGKFARAIERTSVRIKDVNGPRGGKDKVCRIKVVLSGLPSVVVEERHASLQAAMDRALSRTERAVRRSVQRRRTRAV